MEIDKDTISLITAIICLIAALLETFRKFKTISDKEKKNRAITIFLNDVSLLPFAWLILIGNFILAIYYSNWGMSRLPTFTMCFTTSFAVMIIYNRYR